MLRVAGVLLPLLRRLPPETAHALSLRALALGLVRPRHDGDDPILRTRLWGRDFANPIGLAAGYDKNAEVPDALLALGFGFVEIGSVTPRPQPGNPKPRLFPALGFRQQWHHHHRDSGDNNAGDASFG